MGHSKKNQPTPTYSISIPSQYQEKGYSGCFYIWEACDISGNNRDNNEVISDRLPARFLGSPCAVKNLYIWTAIRQGWPTSGILRFPDIIFFCMIYGKVKINGCEANVNRFIYIQMVNLENEFSEPEIQQSRGKIRLGSAYQHAELSGKL
jgi:hypothetical protein